MTLMLIMMMKNLSDLTFVVFTGFIIFCFFFQAEDGIRVMLVTGVQTCALPICPPAGREQARERARDGIAARRLGVGGRRDSRRRSEERRVGKECRSRRAP